MTFDLLQVVHLCVQSCAWDWGEHPLAALRAVWGRAERQGDQNLVDIFLQSFCPVFSTNIFATSLINFFTLIHCAGDPRLADEQMQRLRFCHHDQLWGGPCRHSGETLGIFAYKSKFFQCSLFQSLNGYTLGNRVLQVSFKTNNRKVWRGSTSDSREPNAFQDLRSENCYLAIFSFPRKFIARKKVNFSRQKKLFLNFAISSNMLLILLMLNSPASQNLCFKNLSFCGFFLVIWCTHQMVWSLLHIIHLVIITKINYVYTLKLPIPSHKSCGQNLIIFATTFSSFS